MMRLPRLLVLPLRGLLRCAIAGREEPAVQKEIIFAEVDGEKLALDGDLSKKEHRTPLIV
jgi:hypothetical protein